MHVQEKSPSVTVYILKSYLELPVLNGMDETDIKG